MKVNLQKLLTKLLIIISVTLILPSEGFVQDKGAKSIKSGGGGSRNKSRGLRSSYSSRKRSGRKHWNNQDKETRKRMRRAARNAKRRQKGKPMKNNRLV
ncbi:MAG: hypothetical protein IPM74_13150 [Crocinitomicaceae bacterium]|nr:hypothetical protein [Crocinitomicaceae bacterium]MBK8926821.1 hypothetical protein [Crocinitomicaceae bacterium]